MKKNLILVSIVVALLFGAGGFFGGMKYQQSKRPASGQRFGNAPGGQARGFRPVSGEIIKVDSTSITVKLQDGSSKIVLLSESAQINKSASGTKEDLKVGETVAVFGSDNSDGSVTAQSVQLNPQNRMPPQK